MFQFTRPAWGATTNWRITRADIEVSIHAPRVGRDRLNNAVAKISGVSIHAPRVGRDGGSRPPASAGNRGFNSRAPRGARPREAKNVKRIKKFQFTRPAWGATSIVRRDIRAAGVSIHAPRVGRDGLRRPRRRPRHVSIHAPRVGRDLPRQLRRPLVRVSIHAPRVGRDRLLPDHPRHRRRFNSRAPRGARPGRRRGGRHRQRVSIHAPRVGRDDMPECHKCPHNGFQFTRPAWGATS